MLQQTDVEEQITEDEVSYFKGTCMKKTHIIAIATLAALCGSGAQAQSQIAMGNGYYGELGYSQMKVTGAGGNSEPDAARYLLGSELNANMGLEATYTSTMAKDTRVGYEGSVSYFGIFLKPKMALTADTEVFARIGAVRADITAAVGDSHKGNDLAYGLGIQTKFTQSLYGQLDYMNAYDRSGVTAKGYTLSLGLRF